MKYPLYTRLLLISLSNVFWWALLASPLLAQSPGTAPPSPAPAAPSNTVIQQLEQIVKDQAEIKTRALSAEAQVTELRTRLDTASYWLNIGGVFLAAIISLITITSFYGFIKAERRATEAHSFSLSTARDAEQRAASGFQLSLAGEAAAQRRADEVHQTFLSGSKNTLDLVNATLNLAKEASERAAKSIEARARILLGELDSDAKDLLDSVRAQDDRGLVSDPDKTAALRSLAQRIEGFQNFRLVLPDSIQLSSECLFIRGMDFHLKQQFVDAFRAWKEVAHRDDTDPALRSKAWYWIGYEQNNLANFADASISFEQALVDAEGARRFELRRLLIESRFFNREPEQALLDSLNVLLASTNDNSEDGIAPVRTRILCTIGNIHLSMGNHVRRTKSKEDARPHYELAKRTFQEARADKWALFGLAEAMYWLGDPEAIDILQRHSRKMAQVEEVRRIEPRTKVLAKTTELICCIRVPAFHADVNGIHNQLNEALGRVEGRLTVYSQVQRRNVTKTDFEADVNQLMKEHEGAESAAASFT